MTTKGIAVPRRAGLAGLAARAYLPLGVLWAIYYLGGRMVLDRIEAPITYELVKFVPSILKTLPFFLIGVAFYAYFRLMAVRTGETRLQRIRGWARETPWIEFFALRVLPTLAYIFGLQRIFVALKPRIPDLVPFAWDPLFAAWDRALLMGNDAWVLSHGLLESAYAASVVDELYTTWFYTVFACIFVSAMLPLGHRARLAYLVAFALVWGVGGSLMATLFSSAGPVYYEQLYGDPVFAPLLERLQAMHRDYEMTAVIIIDRLWQGYAGNPEIPALGISAFPSMHLAVATMNACFAFTFGRWWGWTMVLFAAGILFGSVHLGWHYLVDGLAGIALGWVFWALAWRFAGRWLGAEAQA